MRVGPAELPRAELGGCSGDESEPSQTLASLDEAVETAMSCPTGKWPRMSYRSNYLWSSTRASGWSTFVLVEIHPNGTMTRLWELQELPQASGPAATVVAQRDGVTRYRALKLPTVSVPDGDGTGGSRTKNDPVRVTLVHEVSGDM